jgi:hypothetical protein
MSAPGSSADSRLAPGAAYPRHHPVVLLTACINPGQVAFLARRDPAIRLEDYRQSLRRWLADPRVPSLVLCDNSAYDLADLRETCQRHNRYGKDVELISYNGQDFPPHLGKGYGELGIIEHALSDSRLVQGAGLVLKVTGRHYLANVGSILRRLEHIDADVICDLRQTLTFADSRVFCASVAFLADYLVPLRSRVNDSQNVTLEHVLARSIHRAMAEGRRWSMFPRSPDLRGINATADAAIPASLPRRVGREVFREIKTRVLAR